MLNRGKTAFALLIRFQGLSFGEAALVSVNVEIGVEGSFAEAAFFDIDRAQRIGVGDVGTVGSCADNAPVLQVVLVHSSTLGASPGVVVEECGCR